MPFNLEDFFDNISGFIPVLIIIGGAILSLFSKQEKKKTSTKKQTPKKNPVKPLQTRVEKVKQPVSSGTFKTGQSKPKQTAIKTSKVETPKAREVYREEAKRLQKAHPAPVTVATNPQARKQAEKTLQGLDLKRAMVMKEVLDKPVALRKK
ncbi:hypothetical protein ACRW9N_06010 [Listeria aquatica]|uniref:hypothetical protein n=1 Tax=Listeria aquatica TaxID=1494960 RepID=UPI0031F5A1A5